MAEDPNFETIEAIAVNQWFLLEKLPPKDEVAYNGWANLILKKMKLN